MISVCIPTFNQGTYVKQTILSVVNQTKKADEIIVSNDCSTDNTSEVLAELSLQIPELRVINQPVNLGISKNTDACLREATGDYIVRVDSDDLLMPDYIRELSSLLDQFPAAGYAHASVQEIDSEGSNLKIRSLYRNNIFQNSLEALKAAVSGYRVAANILMFRKKALEDAGYISCKENFAEDYFLSASIAGTGWGNVYINKVLSCYRVWSDGGKVRQRRKLAEINGLNAVFNQAIIPAFKKNGLNPQIAYRAVIRFASKHADCLSWNVYSYEEKNELQTAILNLSSSKRTRFYVWAYKNKLGALIIAWNNGKFYLKQQVKKLLSGRVVKTG